MKTQPKFPIIVRESVFLPESEKSHSGEKGTEYPSYVVEYFVLGRRKQKWEADLKLAKAFTVDVFYSARLQPPQVCAS
jgi:hypothetical protein